MIMIKTGSKHDQKECKLYMNSPIAIVFSYANSFELMHNVITQNC